MPHVFALVITGAGLYAGYKWVSRLIADTQRTARTREAERREAMARGRGQPKDLGPLEYDSQAGVYRPRMK